MGRNSLANFVGNLDPREIMEMHKVAVNSLITVDSPEEKMLRQIGEFYQGKNAISMFMTYSQMGCSEEEARDLQEEARRIITQYGYKYIL